MSLSDEERLRLRQGSLEVKRRILEFGQTYAPELLPMNIFTHTAEIYLPERPLPHIQPHRAIDAMVEVKGNLTRVGAFEKEGAAEAWQSIEQAWLDLLPKKRPNGTKWVYDLTRLEGEEQGRGGR